MISEVDCCSRELFDLAYSIIELVNPKDVFRKQVLKLLKVERPKTGLEGTKQKSCLLTTNTSLKYIVVVGMKLELQEVYILCNSSTFQHITTLKYCI